ncbi:MAG: outer membrane lipoprotein-sorting protein [Pseudomonadota bacterium]
MTDETILLQGYGKGSGLNARLADFIVRTRWLWLVMALLLAGVSVMRIDRIVPIDPDARIFFDPANPDRQRLDQFEAMFSKDDNMVILVEPMDGKVFTPETLSAIGRLTDDAWLLPFVRRVNSLTNFQHTYADGDEMIVRDLIVDPNAVTAEEAAEAEKIAQGRIELRNSMIDPASTITQVQVLFTLPGENPETEAPMIYQETRALMTAFEAAHPGIDLRLTGSVAMNNQFAESGQGDASSLTPIMFAVILIIVGLALRSFFGVLSVLMIILLSALGGLGALGWMGGQLNSVTVLAPLYVMTLAVASAVHILVSIRQVMPETDDRKEWARRALTEHMGAIVVACVTTAIGFFSLNFSISPPFRDLGNVTGFGVLAAMFYTLTLLPALIVILPFRRQAVKPTTTVLMERLAEFVIARRRALLAGGSLVIVACAIGITQLKLEDNFVEYFDESYEFRRDTDYAEERLTGMYLLEFPLNSGSEQGINDPEFLKTADAFATWLREQPEIVNVRSLTDTVKRLNMNMHADDPSYMRIPDDADEASQYLFLYELSLGYGMDLTDQIDVGRQVMRISFNMRDVTTADMRDITLRAEDWLAANATGVEAAPTGIVHVFNLISYRDTRAMLTGTAIALVLISAIIMLALRDVRIGMISLIPNVLPAVTAFGLWGYGVGAVTLAIAVVLAATLGIVVDDTVHFLSKYAKARRAGKSPEDAVRYAFRTVGMALTVTTFGLVAGFFVLAQSGFAVNGDLAKLTAITITIALAADFLLLPALLIWLDDRSKKMSFAKTVPATIAAGLIGLALVAFASDVLAETPEEKGLAIAVEADRRDTGFGDTTVSGEMILRDGQGQSSTRAFRNMIKERPESGIGDMTVIVFQKPRDVRGTGLLTHANVEPNDDDQWLYLPAIKRVKRISSSNRTGKFVSSEFSFEDLGGQEVDDYAYKWLRDEPCPNGAGPMCFVVERTPKNTKSGYKTTISWIDHDEYRLDQIEFYNRRGDFEKVMKATGYQQYLGQFWRPGKLTMENQQTGKSTDLIWTDYKFRVGLEEKDFDAQRLDKMAR